MDYQQPPYQTTVTQPVVVPVVPVVVKPSDPPDTTGDCCSGFIGTVGITLFICALCLSSSTVFVRIFLGLFGVLLIGGVCAFTYQKVDEEHKAQEISGQQSEPFIQAGNLPGYVNSPQVLIVGEQREVQEITGRQSEPFIEAGNFVSPGQGQPDVGHPLVSTGIPVHVPVQSGFHPTAPYPNSSGSPVHVHVQSGVHPPASYPHPTGSPNIVPVQSGVLSPAPYPNPTSSPMHVNMQQGVLPSDSYPHKSTGIQYSSVSDSSHLNATHQPSQSRNDNVPDEPPYPLSPSCPVPEYDQQPAYAPPSYSPVPEYDQQPAYAPPTYSPVTEYNFDQQPAYAPPKYSP